MPYPPFVPTSRFSRSTQAIWRGASAESPALGTLTAAVRTSVRSEKQGERWSVSTGATKEGSHPHICDQRREISSFVAGEILTNYLLPPLIPHGYSHPTPVFRTRAQSTRMSTFQAADPQRARTVTAIIGTENGAPHTALISDHRVKRPQPNPRITSARSLECMKGTPEHAMSSRYHTRTSPRSQRKPAIRARLYT